MKLGLNVKLGIVAGLINIGIWYAAARSLNYYSYQIDVYRYFGTLGLLLLGIFFSVYFQKRSNNGILEFRDGLRTGFLYTIILAVFLGAFNYVYYGFIAPDAVDYFLSEAKKAMIEQKLADDEIPKQLEVVQSYFGSMRMAMSTIIMGTLLSLITAAIFRKKAPQTNSTN